MAVKHVKKDLKVIVRVLGAVSQSHFPLRLGDSTFRPSELRGSLSFFVSFFLIYLFIYLFIYLSP